MIPYIPPTPIIPPTIGGEPPLVAMIIVCAIVQIAAIWMGAKIIKIVREEYRERKERKARYGSTDLGK